MSSYAHSSPQLRLEHDSVSVQLLASRRAAERFSLLQAVREAQHEQPRTHRRRRPLRLIALVRRAQRSSTPA